MARAPFVALLLCGCAKESPDPPRPIISKSPTPRPALAAARAGFETRLIRREKESSPAEPPPARMFDLVKYESPAGALSAYVSHDPEDNTRRPAMIWLVGGFGNSISPVAWEAATRENDQTAGIIRKAGIAMMYPSLRGGNDNPGLKEGFLGEVEDVIAAANYLRSLKHIDPTRIYLGGHSTGGTLALLTAAATNNLFRAVFSLGPIDDPVRYGQEYLPYDINDAREAELRAPIRWLHSIKTPTHVFEGVDGNISSLLAMQQENTNPLVRFHPVEGSDHFDVIAPLSELIAEKILGDPGPEAEITITDEEVQARRASQLPPPRTPFPAGDPREEQIEFEYAVYLNGQRSEKECLDQARALIAREFGHLALPTEDEEPGPRLEARLLFVPDAPADYAVPAPEDLPFHSRGITPAEADSIQSCSQALRLRFRHPSSQALRGLQTANRLAQRLAEETNGFPWDEETRQVFSLATWKRDRLDSWSGDFPDAPNHFTIHAYQNGDHIRAITLGLRKFGLPDVVIEQFSWADNQPMGILMNCFAQAMVEGATFENPDAFELNLAQLKSASIREQNLNALKEGGQGRVLIALKEASWDPGDPPNRLIEITADHHEGPDLFARQNAMLQEMFGVEAGVNFIEHTDALEAASKQARARLPELKAAFEAGLEPGDTLLVKAPFETAAGGREWMWIEVQRWDNERITGSLRSSPQHIEGLQAGQRVSVMTADVFDYLRRTLDGKVEGNETGRIIETLSNQQGENAR